MPGPTAAAKQQLGSLLRGLRMNGAADAVSKPAAAAARPAAVPRPQASKPAAGGGGSSGSIFARAAATLQGWHANLGASSQADPANTVRRSVERQEQQGQQQQQRQQTERQRQQRPNGKGPATAQTAAPLAQQRMSAAAPVEVCADCGARFDSVRALCRNCPMHCEVTFPCTLAQGAHSCFSFVND